MGSLSSVKNYEFYSYGESNNAATQILHHTESNPNVMGSLYNDETWFNNDAPLRELRSIKTDKSTCQIIPFPSSENPFDKIDEIHIDDDRKALSVIKNIPKSLKLEYARRIADRLQYLYDVSKEDDPNEVAIASESIKYFLKFIEREEKLKYPDIVLAPSKNIWVEWRTGPDKHFAVEFLPTGDTHFVVFAPDPNHSAKITRASGMTSFDSLIGLVKPYGVLSWALL